MDIRIGIQNLPREVALETSADPKAVAEQFQKALEAKEPSVTLVDDKGRHYIIPTQSIGYVEIGTEETRRIGFGS